MRGLNNPRAFHQQKTNKDMKTITVILEKGKDGYGVSFADIPNVYGFGKTVEDAKKDARDALDGFIKVLNEMGKELPAELKGEFELSFEFETQTLMDFVDMVKAQVLAKAAKINAGQISHYKNGTKPRPEQRKKIVEGLHEIARTLLTVS